MRSTEEVLRDHLERRTRRDLEGDVDNIVMKALRKENEKLRTDLGKLAETAKGQAS